MCSNVGEPVGDRVYVTTEVPNSDLLKSEMLSTQGRSIAAVNISEGKDRSERRSHLVI